VLHGFVGAADHHAISAVNAPDAAAGADVDIVNILLLQLFGASHVIFEHGVAAIDDDVSSFHLAGKSHDCLFCGIAGRDHYPHGAGLAQFADKVLERGAWTSAFCCELIYGIRAQVRDHDFMAVAHKPPHHVATHSAETHHSHLHRNL